VEKKRIVLGTDDRMYLSGDFEQSRYFAFYELEGMDVQDERFVPNPVAEAALEGRLTAEDRSTLLELFAGANVVLTRRIDPDLKQQLTDRGTEIHQILDTGRLTPLLFKYLQGNLTEFPE